MCINMVITFSCKFILIWGHLSNKKTNCCSLIYKWFLPEHLFYGEINVACANQLRKWMGKNRNIGNSFYAFQSRVFSFFLWVNISCTTKVKVNLSLGSAKTWQDCDYCVTKLMPCNPKLNACQKSALHVSNYCDTQIALWHITPHHTAMLKASKLNVLKCWSKEKENSRESNVWILLDSQQIEGIKMHQFYDVSIQISFQSRRQTNWSQSKEVAKIKKFDFQCIGNICWKSENMLKYRLEALTFLKKRGILHSAVQSICIL